MSEIHINELSGLIIGCAIEVHTELGPGLLESSYKESLYYELVKRGFKVEKEKAMPLIYKEVKLECGYKSDLLVEERIIVELKSVETLHDVYVAQVLTYLKLSNCKLGLLMNFNVTRLKDGLKRIANNL